MGGCGIQRAVTIHGRNAFQNLRIASSIPVTPKLLRFQDCDCSRQLFGRFGLLHPKTMTSFCVRPAHKFWSHHMRNPAGSTASVLHVEIAGSRLWM